MPLRPRILLLLLFVALATRGDFHLHLCFDGDEPAVSLHATDHPVHHPGASDTFSHDDADVYIGGPALPRVDDSGIHLPVLLAAVLVMSLLLLPAPPLLPAGHFFLPFPAPPRTRPPSRGPPSY